MSTWLHPNQCPHCGQQAISIFQKVRLGQARPIPCKACGKEVEVPLGASLAAIPFVLAVLGGFFLGSLALYFLAAIVTLVFLVLVRWLFVPLIKAKDVKGQH